MLTLFKLCRLKADVWVFPHHQSSVDGRDQTPIVKSAFGGHSHSRSTPAGPGQALPHSGRHIFQCDKEVAHRETGCKRARKHCADFGWRRLGNGYGCRQKRPRLYSKRSACVPARTNTIMSYRPARLGPPWFTAHPGAAARPHRR